MRPGAGVRPGLPFLFSAVAHALVLAAVWFVASNIEATPAMRVYAVNIVSPPPQAEGEPTPPTDEPPQPEPSEDPEPEPPEPEPEPEPEPPAPQPEPEPTPAPPRPQPDPPRQPERPRTPAPEPERPAPEPERPRQTPPTTGDRPDPNSSGGDNVDMQLRGVQCPTPEYCNNIIRQINRYFRSPGGTGVADIFFVINRNGSISELRLQNSSGSAAFRLAVMEAVEQAGINRAFGALPSAFQADRLPVSFYFRPAR